MNKFIIIIKLDKIINFNQSPSLTILYKKYIKPLKDVKQEKKPLNKIFLLESLNLLLIIKPTKNDPSIEIVKLLSIKNLKKVARKQAISIKIKFFIFTLKKLNNNVTQIKE